MVIFHIDLNAFYASAEVVHNPSLQGKPVVVSGRGRKAVVCTASYEARAYGVRSAMPIFEAKKLCPHLEIVDVNFALYERLSNAFLDLIRTYTPLVEQASIDECYADMSEAIKKFDKPLDLALDIQHRLQMEVGLSCSIGIAPNKFLAKVASDFKKPRGITVLRKREVASKLWPLPIESIGGIGKKTAPLLREKGIHYIRDLADQANYDVLQSILGKNAPVYVKYANGEDDSKIVCNHAMESMSQSTTLDQNIEDYDSVKQVFAGLTRQLSNRLKAEELCGNTISISVRYHTFETITRSRKLDRELQEYEELFAEVMMLFDLHDKQQPIRHLGVGIGNLRNTVIRNQMNLFEWMEFDANREQDQSIESMIASLNAELRSNAVMRLSDLEEKKPSNAFHGLFRK